MYIYKLSATRAIAHGASYQNPIFSGSSINRYDKQAIKKNEKATQESCNKILSEQEENYSIGSGEDLQCRYPQSRISFGVGLSLRPVPVLRPRSLSGRSKYKIRDKIEALYNASNGTKFTFLTLTFITQVDDKTGQKILNKFLTVARKRLGGFLYLWVAERQSDTGNIHFHLISNKRFEIKYFNALWVKQQYNAGLLHPSYTQSDIDMHIHDGTLQTILNPVDVKPINSIDGLAIYLTMYVTKNTGTFNCSVWHCCRTVSKLFTGQLVDAFTFNEASNKTINKAVNTKTGEVYETKVFVTDHAVICNIFNKKYFRRYTKEMDLINRLIIANEPIDKVPTVDYMEYCSLYLCRKNERSKFVIEDLKKNYQHYLCATIDFNNNASLN